MYIKTITIFLNLSYCIQFFRLFFNIYYTIALKLLNLKIFYVKILLSSQKQKKLKRPFRKANF